MAILDERATVCAPFFSMTTTYPSDLSDAEWNCLQQFLPPRSPRSRLRRHSLRSVFDAFFYLLRAGCRLLLPDYCQYDWGGSASSRSGGHQYAHVHHCSRFQSFMLYLLVCGTRASRRADNSTPRGPALTRAQRAQQAVRCQMWRGTVQRRPGSGSR